ncbi:MAG: metallophosphoesterase [Candidatus Eisenbacteria bacterium RBG_16_71_46]|nr:MAG: metallophosphoesterase [Candidatus Eisenbacteria bacterium RBG_16_71_46]OGF22319.1 MAG: metallophosphoesterase [Candidatus Eisenbacteria bacterium RBG_19FT_COMBO_70_11]
MSHRLALFGGVYSNHLALRAVLEDVERRGAGAVWCLGDLGGFGPHPDRALEILRSSGVPALRGNYDDSIGHGRGDCACGYTDPRDNHFAQLSYDYTAARTAADHKRWMAALPEQQRLEIGGRRVLLCHGSPRRVNEFLWESACSDAFLEWLCEAHGADIVACTHTGIHWHRALPSGRHVVNVGAIGRPANDGRTEVWYAELAVNDAVSVEFHPVAYDHDELAREMEAEALPPEFVETTRTGWWTTCLENVPAPERRRGRH